ncbi:hypothetical protein A3Q56_07998 [Intoshia linei]|uniref:Uncharacterized protein n=1 Tax=Intoshia linei TaxID=1819745 RepID=A0A177ASS7_9BILA|nr:hypothetical protein A3Q56_07998 [Intoshia linei]
MEHMDYSIKQAFQNLNQLVILGDDVCNIKQYLQKRLLSNGLNEIMNPVGDMEPSLYSDLQLSNFTSCSVERSFSMLKRMLTKDRPFKVFNVVTYFLLYINK